MKNLLKTVMSFLILSGSSLVMADQAVVQTKPLVNSAVNTSANVNTDANVDANVGKTDVNENESADAKASLRANEATIHEVRQDITRDIKKLKRDRMKLKTAVSQKDDQVSEKLKSDIDNDETAIKKDRVNLKDNLKSKVENDRAAIAEYSQKVRDTRKAVERDNEKMTHDTAKLTDAQTRKATDEIEKLNAVVEKDKAVLAVDTEKLNKRVEYKADMRVALKSDRHHLDVELKRLAADSQTSASDTNEVESEDSTTK